MNLIKRPSKHHAKAKVNKVCSPKRHVPIWRLAGPWKAPSLFRDFPAGNGPGFPATRVQCSLVFLGCHSRVSDAFSRVKTAASGRLRAARVHGARSSRWLARPGVRDERPGEANWWWTSRWVRVWGLVFVKSTFVCD